MHLRSSGTESSFDNLAVAEVRSYINLAAPPLDRLIGILVLSVLSKDTTAGCA